MTVQSEFERKKAIFYNQIKDEYDAMRVPTLEDVQEAAWNVKFDHRNTLELNAFNSAWQEFKNDHKDLK